MQFRGPALNLERPLAVQKVADSTPIADKAEASSVTIRKDFPESWIFDAIDGDELE